MEKNWLKIQKFVRHIFYPCRKWFGRTFVELVAVHLYNWPSFTSCFIRLSLYRSVTYNSLRSSAFRFSERLFQYCSNISSESTCFAVLLPPPPLNSPSKLKNCGKTTSLLICQYYSGIGSIRLCHENFPSILWWFSIRIVAVFHFLMVVGFSFLEMYFLHTFLTRIRYIKSDMYPQKFKNRIRTVIVLTTALLQESHGTKKRCRSWCKFNFWEHLVFHHA